MTEPTPARTQIVRPGAEPTHSNEAEAVSWQYVTLDGTRLAPSAAYWRTALGFEGQCCGFTFPYSTPIGHGATVDQIRTSMEAVLTAAGLEIIDPPDWWAEAQMVRAALPCGIGLSGPVPQSITPWSVCHVPGGLIIGQHSTTPTEALKSAAESWVFSQKSLDALYQMLREAGYSPDPAGMDDLIAKAGHYGQLPPQIVTAAVVRSTLPRAARLIGPIEDLGDGWRIVESGPRHRPIGPLADSPTNALKGFLDRLDWVPDESRSDGYLTEKGGGKFGPTRHQSDELVEAQQIDPAPFGITVTLPDGTRIEIGHKPAR